MKTQSGKRRDLNSSSHSLLPGVARRSATALLAASAITLAGPVMALHIVPDRIGDPHFTSGPCPQIAPKDGAACPNGASQCPAFHDPSLLPPGYDSVSYCATVPAGIGFQFPGVTMSTEPLNQQEQQAFLLAAKRVESYVRDDVTVVVEPYKSAFIYTPLGVNVVLFLGDEFWNPVCAADALLPPYSDQTPTIVANPDGSFTYQGLPETYTAVLDALKRKNAANRYPMKLIDYLPSQPEINVEWPPSFFAWQNSTDFQNDRVNNFLVGTSNNYPITPGAKPFTLCASPATMKMLGFGPRFASEDRSIDDINSPRYNAFVTLPKTDGAIVIPDLTEPPGFASPGSWIYDSTAEDIVRTQLPKAYFEKSLNLGLALASCSDPTQCEYPQGVNTGVDLVAVFNHEINHILGTMQSQYYKVPGEATALPYTYGTALFLLDLFDLDSDSVVSGFGYPGIRRYSDFTTAPRNNNTYEPTTVTFATSVAGLTPWIQFGMHDHVMVYQIDDGTPRYFPFMNYSVFNPDGDIQFQTGTVANATFTDFSVVFLDPKLVDLPPMNVVHYNVQAAGGPATIQVDTVREYSELSAHGWDIDYSTLRDPYHTVSPLAQWYQTCFDLAGVFSTIGNSQCKFSVTPQDLRFLNSGD